ncbi:MAG: M48 family metallopeptidase [Proteobacteria bacterium]|nr:M48 family metallopeptidase [Pseudomonadota bacterium]
MNLYSTIILAALIAAFLLELVSEMLNLRALKSELPAEFEAVYEVDKYRKSQDYTRTQAKFGLVSSAFDIAVLLVFWFSGGFNLIDKFVRSFDFGSIVTGLLFIGLLLLLKTIISLPFSIYSTFVIEERFGFNRTTPLTYVSDMLKGVALTVLLGGPLLGAIIAFFEYAGTGGWFYGWLAVTAFTLLVQFVAPTWIMPLFNKFTPLGEGDLRSAIMDYAASVRFPLDNLFVMDGSKRSSKSNAFFTGFGKNRRIALFDTLIEKHTVAELVAVLAHEIGHYKKRHVIQGMLIGIVHMGILFYLLSIFLGHKGLFEAFFMEEISVYAGLIFFSLLFTPLELVLSLFMHGLSRRNEYEADRFAMETTGSGDAMVAALKKLSVHNLSNLTPHPFYVFLNYSHPPLLQRIAAIRCSDSPGTSQ